MLGVENVEERKYEKKNNKEKLNRKQNETKMYMW